MNKHTAFKKWGLSPLSVQQLVLLAVLMALSLVIGKFSVYLTPTIKVAFVFLASSLIGKFYGPIWTMIVMLLLDFVNVTFFVANATWSPFMAVGVAMSGLIYGGFFYQRSADKQVIWWKVLLAVLLITFIVNLIVNTCAMMILYSPHHSWKVFDAMLATRLPKQLIFFPIQFVLTYFVLNNRIVTMISQQFFPAKQS
ncbi:hypothetical protein FPFC_050110 [Fructobacillus pseudoficulneus]|uniref:Folate family ECF transporter S component n=1 Tax=Fructobacillus pseudoficulneus TaxID=220714 RepID=A0A3F3GV31_9LACO|nr:folate family ECF transporter S component [Fructobacillus pseudoficulneus]GAP03195.1 hypothetical protein FPFC_050110 [Fructobacillus pseudoficulneus]SEH42586.1 ECF transporter S component, folate family [Fructobacillus pseudoficulneus]